MACLWALALREIAAIAGFQADGHDLTYILNGGVILAHMLTAEGERPVRRVFP